MSRTVPPVWYLAMLVGGTMIMALSVYWDAWWHEAIGRESFWIPPHLGIYAGLFISVGGFLLTYRVYAQMLPKPLWVYAAGIAGVVLSGYGDELWHQKFGVEKAGSLESIWSPTHVTALLSGVIAAVGIVFYLSSLGRRGNRIGWLLAGEFAVIVSIATLLLLPFGPETPFRLAGIWGAAPVAFVILFLRFLGYARSENAWALSLITGFNWAGNAILLSNHASPVLLTELVAVGLVPPLIADVVIQWGRRMRIIRSAYTLAGLEWGVIFGIFFYFLTNGLTFSGGYTQLDGVSLVVIGVTSAAASVLAGFLAGSISQRWMLARTLVWARPAVRTGGRV